MKSDFSKYLFLIFFSIGTILPLSGQSIKKTKILQRHILSLGVGSSGYFGDLNDQFIAPDFSISGAYNVRINPTIWLRNSFTLYNISGNDSKAKNPDLIKRNLSFNATNFEFYTGIVFNLFRVENYSDRSFINPFIFLGIGLTTNNPYAKIDGQRHALRPLTTEGNSYSNTAIIIPFGIGSRIKVTKAMSLVGEIGYRKTNSDYLDDVSTRYVAPESLPNDLSRQLADRSEEAGFPRNSFGEQRGSAESKDAYIIVNFSLEGPLFSFFKRKRIKGIN